MNKFSGLQQQYCEPVEIPLFTIMLLKHVNSMSGMEVDMRFMITGEEIMDQT